MEDYRDIALERMLSTEKVGVSRVLPSYNGNFSIEGTSVKSPNAIVCEDNIISMAWTTINASFEEKLIAFRRKVNWIYNVISKEEADYIYQDLIMDKVILNKSRYFHIKSPYIGKDIELTDDVFYFGTPVTPEPVFGANGKIIYWKMEIHWIEKNGIKFV